MQELVQYFGYLVGIVGAIGLIMAGARNLRAGIVVVCLIVLCSAMSTQMEERDYYGRTWLYVIQKNRAELYLGLSCLLSVILAINARHLQITRISGAAALMLVINLFAGVLDIRHNPAGGAQRVVLATVSIGSMALFVPAMLRSWDDFLPLMRALGTVGILWVSGAMVQAVLDKSQMLVGWQNRFVGLLGNPQGTAVFLGPQSAITLWLLLNDPVRRMRWMWACLFAVILMMVAWTGSRTAALLTITGAMFLLRARLGGAVFLLPIVGAALVGVSYIVRQLGIELPFDRLLAGGDTRSAAWSSLLEDAMHSGLFGVGWVGVNFVENAYLLGWVAYGPLMLAMMIFQLGFLAVGTAKLWSVRSEVPETIRRMIDLITAYFVMYFIGAQFEWYILSRVDSNICFVVIFSCAGSSILAMVQAQRLGVDESDAYRQDETLEHAHNDEALD